MTPEQNPREDQSEQAFTPAINPKDLLSADHEDQLDEAHPSETGPNPYYRQIVNYLGKERRENGILDEDGTLDVEAKFDKSAYEIFTRDYYKVNVHDQQGIPMPPYETDEELREFYILKTQQLIEEIVESDREIIFFLDKSARPISWLLKELWPLFVDETKKKLPERKFVSIDANEVMHRGPDSSRPSPEEIVDFHPSDKQIAQVRQIYEHISGDTTSEVEGHPNHFERALIVDEVRVTGATLDFAEKIISAAFPSLDIETASWMNANVQPVGSRRNQAMAASQLPPWYNKNYIEGRGIGDTGENPFLSEPYQGTGREIITDALRTDIKLLAKDIKDGKQAVRPVMGCYQIDPETGLEDTTKPKYKLAKFDQDRNRVITTQYQPN